MIGARHVSDPARPAPARWRRRAGVLAFAALAVRCGEAAPTATGIVRDSAGIRIVEHAGPADLPTWTLGAEPLVEIGRVDSEEAYLFRQVRDAVPLLDGGVAVLEAGASEVRLFDAAGGHVRTLGGAGDGPGELRSPLAIFQRGDSVVVYEWRRDRPITILPLDGSAGRSLAPEGTPRAYNADVWMAGERLIVPGGSAPPPMSEMGAVEKFVSYVAVPLDGAPVDTLARISGGLQARVELEVGGQVMRTADVTPALFQGFPQGGAGPGGPYLWAESGRRPAVRRFTLDGTQDMEIRWQASGRAATAAVFDAYLEHRVSTATDPQQLRRAIEATPVADSLSYFDELRVDAGNRLWVRRYEPVPDEVTRWTIYDAEGMRVALAELPADLTVFRIGEDAILGLRRDSLDVPRVVLLPLQRSN